MNKPFSWKNVDRNKFVHPIDEDDVIGGPKHTNVWYPTGGDLRVRSKTTGSKKLSAKQKANLDRLHSLTSKPVIQMTLEGRVIRRFDSTQQAAEALGVALGTIRSACNGQRPACKGYKWKYAND